MSQLGDLVEPFKAKLSTYLKFATRVQPTKLFC